MIGIISAVLNNAKLPWVIRIVIIAMKSVSQLEYHSDSHCFAWLVTKTKEHRQNIYVFSVPELNMLYM